MSPLKASFFRTCCNLVINTYDRLKLKKLCWMLSPLVSLCFPMPALNNAKGAVRFGYPHALSNTSLYTHLCKCRHLVHYMCARDPAPGCQGVGLRQRLQSLGQKQLEEVPDSPWPLQQKCGVPLKLPQLRWKPLRAALGGSHLFSNKGENSSGPWCFH